MLVLKLEAPLVRIRHSFLKFTKTNPLQELKAKWWKSGGGALAGDAIVTRKLVHSYMQNCGPLIQEDLVQQTNTAGGSGKKTLQAHART